MRTLTLAYPTKADAHKARHELMSEAGVNVSMLYAITTLPRNESAYAFDVRRSETKNAV